MKIRYTAKDFNGKTVKGMVESGTIKTAANLLREQSLIPMTLKEDKNANPFDTLNTALGRVTDAQITAFTRQLSTMITAGLPLTDALNLLKVQSSPAFSIVIGGILTDVQSGISLSTSMAKHPNIFNKVYIALVKAGEAAGVMEKVLNRLADTSEKGREFRNKVVGAMIYPIIILIGMVIVMILMMVMVVPQMKDMYADFGKDLPFETRALIAISDFMVAYWWLLLFGGGGLFILLRRFFRTEYGQSLWGRWMFKMPIMGPLMRQTILAEFSRTSALLLSAGVSVVESLRIVADSVGNVILEKDVKRIANQVEKGFPVSISFSESEMFPPLIGQMVAVGEETGKLDEVLAKVSAYFESESEQKVKGLTTAIEPIILMVMAVGVGFLLYAIVMPMYGITDSI